MDFLAELHPRIVHFPIAFFVLYFLFETSGTVLKKDFLTKSAYLVLILGIVMALGAVLTGNQSHEIIKPLIKDAGVNALIAQHEDFATYSLWYFSALFFYRTYLAIKKRFDEKSKYLFILLGLIGFILILLTGYYGGELVFQHGAGTKLFGK